MKQININVEKSTWQKDNELIKEKLDGFLKSIGFLTDEIEKNSNISIKNQNWFINFFDFYLKDALEFLNNFQEIKEETEKILEDELKRWLKINSKAFFSDVEKSTKWYVSILYKDPKFSKTWNEANKHLCSSFYDYPIFIYNRNIDLKKALNNDLYNLKNSFNILDIWRRIYNQNKHGTETENFAIGIEDSYFIEDFDILSYVSLWAQFIELFLANILRIFIDQKFSQKERPSRYFQKQLEFPFFNIIKKY